MKITKQLIADTVFTTDQIRTQAARFVSAERRAKNRNADPASNDEITLHEHELIHSYTVNTSCRCHPEYATTHDSYPVDDFMAWLEKEGSAEFEM